MKFSTLFSSAILGKFKTLKMILKQQKINNAIVNIVNPRKYFDFVFIPNYHIKLFIKKHPSLIARLDECFSINFIDLFLL